MDQILVRGANKSISRSSGFDLSALNWHRTRMVTRGIKIQARLSLAKSGRDETKKRGCGLNLIDQTSRLPYIQGTAWTVNMAGWLNEGKKECGLVWPGERWRPEVKLMVQSRGSANQKKTSLSNRGTNNSDTVLNTLIGRRTCTSKCLLHAELWMFIHWLPKCFLVLVCSVSSSLYTTCDHTPATVSHTPHGFLFRSTLKCTSSSWKAGAAFTWY